ncbi:MAG: hypothetical protein ABL957_11925 [Parvularculaceae bacterium]
MTIGALVVLVAAQASEMFGPFESPDSRHCCQHGNVALHIALADAYCGLKNRMFQPTGSMFLGLDEQTAELPLAEYIVRETGAPDLAAACKAAAPYANFHEYSVSALMKAALALPPKDTALSLMEKIRAFVIAAALIGGALAALCRIGVVPIYGAYGVALSLTRTLEPYAWSDYYYYLPVLLLFMVSVTAAFGFLLIKARTPVFLAFALFVGLAFEIAVNLRTSYGAAFAIGLLLSALAGLALLWRRRASSARIASRVAVIAIAIGSSMAANAFIFKSFRAADAGSEIEYHLFWHPVVLGLAVPGTEFTRTEGISWSDAVGVDLARRVDPDVGTDGLTYEAALKTYYLSLWREHPKEMVEVYWRKLGTFGADHAEFLARHRFSGFLSDWNLHGAPLVLLIGAAFLAMTWLSQRLEIIEFGLFAGATSVFLVMMQMEFVLIYSQFAYTHNGSSLALILLMQWCVVIAASLWIYDRFVEKLRGRTS